MATVAPTGPMISDNHLTAVWYFNPLPGYRNLINSFGSISSTQWVLLTNRKSWYFSMLTNVLFRSAPSSNHSNGNNISGSSFITSISFSGVKSMLICSLLAADIGVPEIWIWNVFKSPKYIQQKIHYDFEIQQNGMLILVRLQSGFYFLKQTRISIVEMWLEANEKRFLNGKRYFTAKVYLTNHRCYDWSFGARKKIHGPFERAFTLAAKAVHWFVCLRIIIIKQKFTKLSKSKAEQSPEEIPEQLGSSVRQLYKPVTLSIIRRFRIPFWPYISELFVLAKPKQNRRLTAMSSKSP